MPELLIEEAELRAALRNFAPDRARFAEAVRRQLDEYLPPTSKELLDASSRLSYAASLLPISLLAGSKTLVPLTIAAPSGWSLKLLSVLLFPAVSFFLLFGTAVYAVFGIRKLQKGGAVLIESQRRQAQMVREWSRSHRWPLIGFYVFALGTWVCGNPWITFLFFVFSLALLVYFLRALRQIGLGTRRELAGNLCASFGLLLQLSVMQPMWESGLRYLNSCSVAIVFASAVSLLSILRCFVWKDPSRNRFDLNDFIAAVGICSIAIPLCGWMLVRGLMPVSVPEIQRFVEGFDRAKYESANWQVWEEPADFVREKGLSVDWTKPKELFLKSSNLTTTPFIWSVAVRTGIVEANVLMESDEFKAYWTRIESAMRKAQPSPIGFSVRHDDWAIRSLLTAPDTPNELREYLRQALQLELEAEFANEYRNLEVVLRASELLQLYDRDRQATKTGFRNSLSSPLAPFPPKPGEGEEIGLGLNSEHREQVHEMLTRLQQMESRLFGGSVGGFRSGDKWKSSDLRATAHAVGLMRLYGIPDGVNQNALRSFLKPSPCQPTSERIGAGTLWREFQALPGYRSTTWLDFCYGERNLCAAILLVGMAFYAVLNAPTKQTNEPEPLESNPIRLNRL